MKRIVLSVIIIAVSVILTIISYTTVAGNLNKMTDIISKNDSHEEVADKLYSEWNDKKMTMSMLLKHEDIDTLDGYVMSIYDFNKNGQKDECKEYIVITDNFIKGIVDGEKLTWDNIF